MAYDDLRYNEIRQKSIHNSFQRHESIYDQLFYWRVRSLEADIHPDHPLDGDPGPDDWFVYHYLIDLYSSVHTLSQFLQTVAGFHRAVPDHEVITLFLDAKEAFPRTIGAARSRRAFDELLDRHLGDAVYRPSDLLARDPEATDLTDVVQGVGWPTLAELRGRFVVVLTGSELQLGNYIGTGETQTDRAAFVSGNVKKQSDIGKDRDVVIYNMSKDHVELAAAVGIQGYVSRAYYIDDEELWDAAEIAHCNHVATDMVNARVDPWASTSGPTGFPFRAHTGSTPQETERGTVGGIWARSGDMWGREDSCLFHHRRCGRNDLEQRYDFAVSGPNSHTEGWTKGGIVARESLEPDSPYFGVFRPGSGSGLRVQFRVDPGRTTTVLERHIGTTWTFGSHFDQDSLVYVRLDVGADGTSCAGYGSIDGSRWVKLGEFDEFKKPLRFHGLTVSAHGQRRGAKFLFVVPGGGDPPPFDTDTAIGTRDEPASGWVDWAGTRRWRTSRFSR